MRELNQLKKKKALELLTQGLYKSWHRAIFPGGLPPSIVAADRLYLRVRDGNGCVPVASAPRNFSESGYVTSTLETAY